MDCCERQPESNNNTCPRCETVGRTVELLTVKSLLRARALERVAPMAHYICPEAKCETVYFSEATSYSRDDVRVPVFQKENVGGRLVCYCFEITEIDVDAATESRVRAHVQAGRCACEVKNPEGRCCLGNLRAVMQSECHGAIGVEREL